ncbi:WD40 repeat domain-containing protein [Streptomyces sp. T028]|uniref:WD40 repeat domain-containing protein n=1 Tax=Streptomyces sp. T028 TaxID=3394379 RepID=UPI003A89D167
MASVRPSALNATEVTAAVSPFRLVRRRPMAVFHSCTPTAVLAVARTCPSGLKAIASIGGAAPTLTGRRGTVTSPAFSPDGHTLAAGGADGVLRLWDTGTRRAGVPQAYGTVLATAGQGAPVRGERRRAEAGRPGVLGLGVHEFVLEYPARPASSR